MLDALLSLFHSIFITNLEENNIVLFINEKNGGSQSWQSLLKILKRTAKTSQPSQTMLHCFSDSDYANLKRKIRTISQITAITELLYLTYESI